MQFQLDALIAPLIASIRASLVHTFAAWLVGPAWNDSIGRTILLAALGYLVGYSIYGGYLSRFTGSVGTMSLSRLGIDLTDVITLLPTALLTIARLWKDLVNAVLKFVLLALYVFVPLYLGALLGFLINYYAQTRFVSAEPYLQIGLVGYLIVSVIGVAYFVAWPRSPKWPFLPHVVWGFLWVLLLETMAVATVALISEVPVGAPLSSATAVAGPALNNLSSIVWAIFLVLREIAIGMWILILFLLLPIGLGNIIARNAIEHKHLSLVTSLVLSQPLASLKPYEFLEAVHQNTPDMTGRLWFMKSQLEVNTGLDVFTYTFTEKSPLYLVDSFHSATAFYLPTVDGKSGQLISVTREIIHAIALQSVRPVAEAVQPQVNSSNIHSGQAKG